MLFKNGKSIIQLFDALAAGKAQHPKAGVGPCPIVQSDAVRRKETVKPDRKQQKQNKSASAKWIVGVPWGVLVAATA